MLTMYADDYDGSYPWRSSVDGYPANTWSYSDGSVNLVFDLHETIEHYQPSGETYLCPLRQDENWEDYWPLTGHPDPAVDGNYRWHSYNIFTNFASSGVTYFDSEGNAVSWESIMPRNVADSGEVTKHPIIGDKVTWNNGASTWFQLDHVQEEELPNLNGVRGQYAFMDGSVERFNSGFVTVNERNSSGWKQAWRTRE